MNFGVTCGAAIGTYCKIEHRREAPEGDMQRRGGSGQSVKEQRTARLKARKAPTAHVSGADPQEQLDGRTRELHEALEQQAAGV